MSRTTTIPRFAQVLGYTCAAIAVVCTALIIDVGAPRDLVPALVLAALAAASHMGRQRLSRTTQISLADIPITIAILLLEPGLAMLVGVILGLLARGRLGPLSRAVNLCAFAIPVGAASAVFALLRDTFGAQTPSDGAAGWFVSALAAVIVYIILHSVVIDFWSRLAYGYPFWEMLREAALPVAKYDFASGFLVVTLLQIGLLLDGWTRALPVIVALIGVTGLWLFLSATRKQLESQELKDEFFRAIFVSFARLLEMKDPETAIHSARVAIYSRDIAQQMGLSQEDQSRVHLAGLLHDVGKVGVPDEILLKPGRLTDEERAIMQRHARLSAEALQGIPGFGDLVRMIYAHHERLDGSGYPEGTGAPDLPLGARILGVADTFEALTSNRPYRRGRPAEAALQVFDEDSHLFDPTVVYALKSIVALDNGRSEFGRITEFSEEWSRAAKYLDVRLDEETFVVPPEPTSAPVSPAPAQTPIETPMPPSPVAADSAVSGVT